MKKEFTVERDGRTFVLYAGLLDLAHERGLKSITTTLIQIPNEMNGMAAICHATVETAQGTFTGLGDASPSNVTRLMAPHLIRMAETRAKARALRDAVNVGVTALEELADVDDVDDVEQEAPRAPAAGRASAGSRRALRAVEPDELVDDEGAAAAHQPAFAFEPGRNGHADDKADGPAAGATKTERGAPAAAGARAVGGPPATAKQLETITRMARAAGKTVETEGLTRAQASEIISSLIGEMSHLRAS
ncbi:MAG: hypothetical protein HY332_20670 [Chloroflexi bacterium]|nr:hypothetical protein [Chloroflexota bacterium]